MSDLSYNPLKSFNAGMVFGVLNRIKLGAGTLLQNTESTQDTECLLRLHACGMLSMYEGGPARIATLTQSGLVLHAFLSCWASTER